MDIDQDTSEVQESAAGQTLSNPAATSSSSSAMPPNASVVAEAFEKKLRQQRAEQEAKEAGSYAAFDEDHEKRQEFRRMIDPGILRPNPRPLALKSLKTLLTIAENILQHPDDPKYLRFKPTNPTIKSLLVDPKGTLEYARTMGFNPDVENFQPFYTFNKKKHVRDLQIGAEILKEALDREVAKEERQAIAKKQEKAAAAAQIANIKQAFLDDRKSRTVIERRERELREARAAAAARGSIPPVSPKPSAARMPGSGHLLNGQEVTLADPPTNHEDDEDDDEY